MAFPNLLNMFRGKAGGSQMKPLQELQKEELDNWGGYDSGNEKSRQTQYANAYNRQSDEQNTAMFGQNGDVKKQMGTIWDQLKTGAGKASKQFSEDYDYNYKKRFGNPEAAENPYPNPNQPTVEDCSMEEFSNADGTSTDEIYNKETGTWGPIPTEEPAQLPEGVDTDGNKIPDLIQAPGKFGHGKTADGQDIMYPAGKNLLGYKTDPLTKGSIDDMSQNFIMGGFGSGGFGSIGKSAKKGILGLYNKFKGGY